MSSYMSFQDILNFIGFGYKFDTCHEYPFNRDPKNVIFSFGQILIPKYGIREMVQNKIRDIKDTPINSIKMMYQIPFTVVDHSEKSTFDKYKSGVVNQNIELTFRYDKEYKYGEITTSIYEVCYWITEHAVETNDFFIIPFEFVSDFFSTYIAPNQWGLGSTVCNSGCQEGYYGEKINSNSKYPKLYKCTCCEQMVDMIDNDGRCSFCGSSMELVDQKGKESNTLVNDDRTVTESQTTTKESDNDRE